MIEVFFDEQGSDEWYRQRAGIPTASMFGVVQMKPGPRGGVPKTRQTYLYRMAAETITGTPIETYSNHHMERGKIQEEEAADLYAFLNDIELETVGFVRRNTYGGYGASPDRLVGKAGLLEIKTCLGHIQIERLLAGVVPSEHLSQCHGQLMATGRKWVDFMSYCPGLQPLIVRVSRDTAVTKQLAADIAQFNKEKDALIARIRGIR